MKAHVDPQRCQGHAVCAMLAPDAFELDDDDHATALAGDVSTDQEGLVGDAAQLCPEQAITLS